MNKQSEAKAAQGYNTKPVPQTCKTCEYYHCDRIPTGWLVHGFSEKNKRCAIGGFPVQVTATCNRYAQALAKGE